MNTSSPKCFSMCDAGQMFQGRKVVSDNQFSNISAQLTNLDLHHVDKKTEQECIVYIIRRKHCRAVHKDFKDFLSSARLWSPKRGSAAVEQPCSRALPFVSFVPNSLPCLATQASILATLASYELPALPPRLPSLLPCHPSSHPFSCKHLADLVFISKSVLFCPS